MDGTRGTCIVHVLMFSNLNDSFRSDTQEGTSLGMRLAVAHRWSLVLGPAVIQLLSIFNQPSLLEL